MRFEQFQTRAGRNEVVQVVDPAGFPQDRVLGLAVRKSRSAHDLPASN